MRSEGNQDATVGNISIFAFLPRRATQGQVDMTGVVAAMGSVEIPSGLPIRPS